ncbi:cell wall anchor protein [Polymorphospora sp. NPDC051019]|uniref:cell wall anchor protein n=1 Tax=Polymorphospora sp. NPDC051019 TaxID=3155725 RepID=UPI00344A5BAC
MISSKLSLRRPLAVVGAAFLGLAAAVAVASPASAHHSVVDGKAACDTTTGEWVVDWTVTSVAPAESTGYRLYEVLAKPVPVTGIAVTEGDGYPLDPHTPLTGTQRLPGTTQTASLQVKGAWDSGHEDTKWKKKTITLGGVCEKEEPPPATAAPTYTIVTDCDGLVEVTLTNGKDATAPAKFKVVTAEGFEKSVEVAPGEENTVEIPAEQAGEITVTEAGQEKPLFTGSAPEAEGCPTAGLEVSCEDMTFSLTNPEDGSEPFTAVFTPSTGDVQKITVAPGESKSVKFAGSAGLTIDAVIEGYEDDVVTFAWDEEKPEDCPAPGGGGGGDLPLTGAAAGGIAAGAALLLAVGGVLFYLARRRRVTFTA